MRLKEKKILDELPLTPFYISQINFKSKWTPACVHVLLKLRD